MFSNLMKYVMLPRFPISVIYNGQQYRYMVEQMEVTERKESYKLITKSQAFILSNNRPLFRAKGIRHRKPMWRLEEGNMRFQNFMDLIAKAIEEYLNKNGIQ